MDEICDVTITGPNDMEWAADFVSGLVKDRLVACGNIVSAPIRSIYRWEGKVEFDDEVMLVLHTRRSLVSKIIERAKAAHPDDVPQVLAVPVVEANPAYHQWVLDETRH